MASSKKKHTAAKVAKNASKKPTPTPETVKEVVADAMEKAKNPLEKLYRWNKWLAIIHAFQALAILVVSDERLFPVTTSYLTPNPLFENQGLTVGTHQLFDINAAWLIATFFLISAAAHTAMATFYRRRYESDLAKGINRLRWIEYAVSASTMMVAIGFLSGIYDLSAAIMLFVLTAVMNMAGLAMEIYNEGKARVNWLAYVIGCIAGVTPWIAFAVYAIGASLYGDGQVPAFVYWIYGSMFVCFSSFAVNMLMQYRRNGRWADYIFGEQVYMILSLVAKTVLAWQVFAGLLRP